MSLKVFEVVIGDLPTTEKSTSSGNNTGSWFSGTGWIPHLSQYTTGIGAPQYLWREINQSLNLYCVLNSPNPLSTAFWVIAFLASVFFMPLNSFEFTKTPSSVYAFVISLGFNSLSTGEITTFNGKLYFLANAKSLSSWVGTAITAPVPYSTRA